MSRFTDAKYVFSDGKTQSGLPEVTLTTELVYEIDHLGSGWIVRAPIGFRCDLTSMRPWMLKFSFGRYAYSRLSRASIPHDLLRKDLRKSKWTGDYVFWEAMGVDKVPMWLRIIATGLVLFNFTRT